MCIIMIAKPANIIYHDASHVFVSVNVLHSSRNVGSTITLLFVFQMIYLVGFVQVFISTDWCNISRDADVFFFLLPLSSCIVYKSVPFFSHFMTVDIHILNEMNQIGHYNVENGYHCDTNRKSNSTWINSHRFTKRG